MTEKRVSFLHKIISCLPHSDNSESIKRLRSFYLMRCKEATSGCGLPIKYFSQKTKCPRCCLDWNKEADVKITPNKLSCRQKRRIKCKKIRNANEKKLNLRKAFLRSNQMEQTCSFCKHTTVTTLPKPLKDYPKKVNNNQPITRTPIIKQKMKKLENFKITKKTKSEYEKVNVKTSKKNIATDVYSNSSEVFSLKNKQNTLASTIKEPQKIIKNNKKKKDKFAGLCQKAVLASAKQKQCQAQDRQEKNNSKLSLFLKPSVTEP